MNPQGIAKSYQSNAVLTASPGKLVQLMLEGALRFVRNAKTGFEEEDYVKRNEIVHNNIQRAQSIVAELQASLNLKVQGDFAPTMYRLYDFVNRKLLEANHKKVAEPLDEVEKVLGEIEEAWSTMLSNTEQNN